MHVTLDYGKTGLAVTLPDDRLLAPPLTIKPADRSAATGAYDRPSESPTCEMDEWQLLMFKKVLQHCRVKVVSGGLSPEVLRRCRVEPATTVEQAVSDALAEYGPQATVAVIPKGPYVLPVVAAA